jgi:hypothetical protein
MSTSVVGAPRLASWEVAALGVVQSAGNDTGYWDSKGQWTAFPDNYRQQDLRTDLWGVVRLHDRWELTARLPWLANYRVVPGLPAETGSGLGDTWVAARWSPVQVGESDTIPALALVGSVMVPTGRWLQTTGGLLGTGATGRGVWAAGLALQVERVWWPWFVRAESGGSIALPADQPGVGHVQYGPTWQSVVSAGQTIGKKLVLAGQMNHSWEGPQQLDQQTQTQSGQRGWTAAVSAAWTFALQWTMHAQLASEAPTHWLTGRNHTERWQASLGVRYGFVQ